MSLLLTFRILAHVLLATLLTCLTTMQPVNAANERNPKPVTVENAPDVKVANKPDVNVANTPDVVVTNTAQEPVPVISAQPLTHLGVVAGEHVTLQWDPEQEFLRRYDPVNNRLSAPEFVVPPGKAFVVTDISGTAAAFVELGQTEAFLLLVGPPDNDDPFSLKSVYQTVATGDASEEFISLQESLTAGVVVWSGYRLIPEIPAADFLFDARVLGYLIPVPTR